MSCLLLELIHYTKPARSSKVSPFLGAANAPFILLTAIRKDLYKAATGVAPLVDTFGHC